MQLGLISYICFNLGRVVETYLFVVLAEGYRQYMGTWQEVTEYQNKTVEKPYLEG
jgi:hypothetical protein